jgi:preprotein translocase subunit SecB
MRISPLQLEHYFVSDLHFSANRGFDPKKEVALRVEHFGIETALLSQDYTKWQVTLRVKLQPAPSVNAPCSFTLEIVGFFHVAREFPQDNAQRLVKTNAPTMLFGIARELVRDITSHGPHPGLMLPSVSFFEPDAKPQPTSSSAAGSTGVRKG